jgi:acetoacetyl-CoA synthetase
MNTNSTTPSAQSSSPNKKMPPPTTKANEVVWQPTNPEATAMSAYRRHVNRAFTKSFNNTRDLQQWSIDSPHAFWIDVYKYLDLVPQLPNHTTKAYDDSVSMRDIPKFFPELRLNYAENIFHANPQPHATALVELREDEPIRPGAGRVITWREFRERVRRTASALKASGVREGDRVGAIVANSAWAVVLFYAAASMGAIFTCISPDIGVEGCISRLRQVGPKILFFDSHVLYKGKMSSTGEKVGAIRAALARDVECFTIRFTTATEGVTPSIDDFLRRADSQEPLQFRRLPFSHPLMICYSSGTTGAPKCIVHQHGLILQHKKNSVLHNNLSHGDVVMQYSSTSWVVFYTMCSQMSAGTSLVVYNGSPLYPDAKQLLRICDVYKVTYLGVSPRLLLEIEMSKTIPKREFDLSPLRMVFTTGAPLSVEQYRWFYRTWPTRVQISNTAGGTDTATNVIGVDPCGPVRAGEMQILSLGMDIDILDPDSGESIAHTGEAGEMVIRKPFPSMPCCFWGEDGAKVYLAAYFEKFPTLNCWAVHDWLYRNPATGGYVMPGRSDGVLSKFATPVSRYTPGRLIDFTRSIRNPLRK